MNSPAPDPFVQFIRSQPGMSEALMRQHRDDGTGHCALCSAGGQTGRNIWPCRTYTAAVEALRDVW